MRTLYLGLDGGGTKTAASIIAPDGAELGRGSGGGGNIAHHYDAALIDSVRTAVGAACAAAGLRFETVRFAGVCAGMAGYSAVNRRHDFAGLLRTTVPARKYRLEPDYVTAYWGATSGAPGIVMIAGTGAVAYGRNKEGREAREDGLGYLLGDRGSGFDLGLEVLRYTLAEIDAGRSDTLTQAVLEQTGTQTQEEIVQWLYGDFQPARVATLAPTVGRLAETGEPAARKYIALMAQRLRLTVQQLRIRLEMPPEIPIYPLGGLWKLGESIRSAFAQPRPPQSNIDAHERNLQYDPFIIAAPNHDAAYGAALLAKSCSGGL